MSQRNNPSSTISITLDLETQNAILDYSLEKSWNRSTAIRHLIKMGMVYELILEEQIPKIAAGANDGEQGVQESV